MLIAGVDEAGRGCVIGPLVVAGIAVKSENLPLLVELGVKDSKMLTAKKREELYPQIIKLTQSYHTIKVLPYIIDKAVRCTKKGYKLNRLEAQTMAKIIEKLKPDEAYVDAADVIQERFGEYIKECLTIQATVISKHKADITYPIVSAASIIAKVERDRELEVIKEKYGDCGSGYLTDAKILMFLERLLTENGGDYPSCVRKAWEPARRVKAEHGSTQKTLG
ncbi:MAG TPA: ribonuclease HII [Candidatus Acidoferrales bacterium]|nr:ribonuclease HII [Candidatus Acidoferrales bacterium]